MNVLDHRFLKVRRTLIDVSSMESKREGILLYRPGRWWLRWIPVVMGWFAWLPWPGKRLECLNVRMFECSNVGEVWRKIEETIGACKFVTIYLGNGSAKSKLTIKARVNRQRLSALENARKNAPPIRPLSEVVEAVERHQGAGYLPSTDGNIVANSSAPFKGMADVIVKLGNTPAAAVAITNEYETLKRLNNRTIRTIEQSNNFSGQVPEIIGEIGAAGPWTWSVQTVLPRGKSPNRLQQAHFEFLGKLKAVELSHGDFAPWNCAIVEGKLVVWDWEDAGPWVDGKDEGWFRKQVRELLGVGEEKV